MRKIIESVDPNTLANLACGVFQAAYGKTAGTSEACCKAGQEAVDAFLGTLDREALPSTKVGK